MAKRHRHCCGQHNCRYRKRCDAHSRWEACGSIAAEHARLTASTPLHFRRPIPAGWREVFFSSFSSSSSSCYRCCCFFFLPLLLCFFFFSCYCCCCCIASWRARAAGRARWARVAPGDSAAVAECRQQQQRVAGPQPKCQRQSGARWAVGRTRGSSVRRCVALKQRQHRWWRDYGPWTCRWRC